MLFDPTSIDMTTQRTTGNKLCSTITFRRHRDDPGLTYFLHHPPGAGPTTPVIVSVHGISRNARAHVETFAPDAPRQDAVVVAPLFDEDRYSDYQRLGRRGRGARADLALDAILSEVGAITGTDTARFFLHGYSGGAQFAHRFALAYPDRVRALAVSSAGWYTMPDPDVGFPYGLARHKGLPDLRFQFLTFLRRQVLVLVGDRDTARDATLNKAPQIDKRQGRTRLARAKAWVESLNETCDRHGLAPSARLQLLADCAHSFEDSVGSDGGDLAAQCLNFFLGPCDQNAASEGHHGSH